MGKRPGLGEKRVRLRWALMPRPPPPRPSWAGEGGTRRVRRLGTVIQGLEKLAAVRAARRDWRWVAGASVVGAAVGVSASA